MTKDTTGGQAQVSKEQLILWDPDFIFIDHAGSSGNDSAEVLVEEMLKDPDYVNLVAIAKDQVKIVPTGAFFWNAGVQKPLMLLWMAQILHPDKFKDVDMMTELKYFYSEFFEYQLTDKEAELILAHKNPEK